MNMPRMAFLASSVVPPSAQANPVSRSVQEDAGGGGGDGDIPIIVPDYSTDQCSTWIDAAYAADTDKSGGLSADEYHAFLMGVDEPNYADGHFDQYADSYASLPWMFKMVHKSLACRCILLPGYEENCCVGADAEIPLVGISEEDIEALPPERQRAVAEYRAHVCDSVAATFEEAMLASSASPTRSPVMADATTAVEPDSSPAPTAVPASAALPEVELVLDVVGSVLDYSSFDYSTIFDGTNEGVPDFYDARDVQTNKDDNGVLGQVIKSFGKLSLEVLSELNADGSTKRNLRASIRALQETLLGELKPVKVTDIGCPAGLPYAPKDAYCLNFKFNIVGTDEAYFALAGETLAAAINRDGRLYSIVLEDYPNTNVTGLGDPGKGIEYTDSSVPAPTPVKSPEGGSEESSGVGPLAIFFIVIAVVLLPMALLAMYARYQKAQTEERRGRLAAYEASKDTQPGASQAMVTAKDEDDGTVPGERQPSPQAEPSPVPVPVPVPDKGDDASSVPSVWSESQDEGRKSSSFVDEAEEPGVTAGSALAAMGAAGAAAAFASSKGAKENTEATTEGKATSYREVRALVEQVGAQKSAEELWSAYSGREDQLLMYLRRLRSEKEIGAEIESLVEATNSPKSASELMILYKGREELLLGNLKRLKSKQDTEKIESLVAMIDTGDKSADELLSSYEGREAELLRYLEKMQQKQMKAKVKSLVESVQPGKSAEELLSTFRGREKELIKNLEKMKSLNALVQSTNPGRSTQEMLTEFAGREDEMVRSLREKKSKQDVEKVSVLVASVGSEKSAEELLRAYQGRHDELIHHLEKLQKKQAKAKVDSLVAIVKPGKSTKELLLAYDGKEDELIKHLTKLKSKQEKQAKAASDTSALAAGTAVSPDFSESIRALVDDVSPGKSAEELSLASDTPVTEVGRQDKDKGSQGISEEGTDVPGPGDAVSETTKGDSVDDDTAPAIRGEACDEGEGIGRPTESSDTAVYKGGSSDQSDFAMLSTGPAPAPATAAAAANVNATDAHDLQEQISSLIASVKPGMSEEELLAAYKGREQELREHLEKLRSYKGGDS